MSQEIYFTSDHHFFHHNIIEYEQRPFADVNEMNAYMIDQWNAVVKPNDLVFHLGDIGFFKGDQMKETFSILNGRKILLRGNHDKGYTTKKLTEAGFDVHKYYIFENHLLSHHPQPADKLHQLIALTDIKGNLCGHVHSQIQHLDLQVHRCLAVELNDYKPFHYDEVIDTFLRT